MVAELLAGANLDPLEIAELYECETGLGNDAHSRKHHWRSSEDLIVGNRDPHLSVPPKSNVEIADERSIRAQLHIDLSTVDPIFGHMDQPAAEMHILGKLRHGLPRARTYHNFSHTLDVYRSTMALAMQYKLEEEEMDLLRTAALYHDSGFLNQDHDHEEAGCAIAREALPEFGYSDEQIQRVCDLVMATKLPTDPKDTLGMILCDADLDYLGRSDFFRIGATLFQEFKHFGIVKDERDWNELQVRFMEAQVYYTPISRAEREPVKQLHLLKVKAWLAENH